MAFFSIIIPTYNRAHTIRRPIDSILAQTFTDWELIIVDDGSTDNTKEIIDGYNDQRIRYVWQENQERSEARNHGISLAKGEWICFQDSDDEYFPDHLQILYDFINGNDDCNVVRTGLLLYQEGQLLRESTSFPSKYDQYPYECIQAFAFKKKVLMGYKFPLKYFNSEDLHFLLRICRNNHLYIINKFTGIYNYDLRSSGLDTKNCKRVLYNNIACLNDILSWNNELIIPFIKRQICFSEVKLILCICNSEKERLLGVLWRNLVCILRYPQDYFLLLLWLLKKRIKFEK